MNKYQEAFNNFKKLKYIPNAVNLTMNLDLLQKDIVVLQELVDKETPKTPHKRFIFSDNEITMPLHFCDCEKVVHLGDRYCSNCGQKLDWSDEDE